MSRRTGQSAQVGQRILQGLVIVLFCAAGTVSAEDWPQWRGPNRDGVWRETGIVKKFSSATLAPLWEYPVSSGYTGPTVADGRVYVMDRTTNPEQLERVICVEMKTGKHVWTHPYPCVYRKVGYEAGPRASVTVDAGKAYSLGTMGHLFCFNAATGDVHWNHDLYEEYSINLPIWGICSSPLVDGNLLIVQVGGENGACIVAFDKNTGAEKWRALRDRASYSAPIVIEQAGRRVLVCWTGDNIAGLDPQSGEVFWKHPFVPKKMVLSVATPILDRDRLFVTAFYDGSLMLALDPHKLAVSEIWKRRGPSEQQTDALHSIISTPYFAGDHVYGVDSYGELRCLSAGTGDRIWEDLKATPKARWSNIHFVKHESEVWMFNERGELLITRLSPEGMKEISRAKIIEPTLEQLRQRGGVCWAHPAFANRCVFIRNDVKLVCVDLAE